MGKPDTGIGQSDASLPQSHSQLDILVGIMDGHACRTFRPENYGLNGLAEEVQLVISGTGKACDKIYINPQIDQECEVPQGQILVESSIEPHPDRPFTIFVMKKDGSYNLVEGEAIYKAMQTACLKFPEAAFKVLGLELRPSVAIERSTEERREIQARVEGDVNSDLALARVHIWKGPGRVYSIPGDQFLNMQTGIQILVDPKNFSVQEAHSFGENPLPSELELRTKKHTVGPMSCSIYIKDLDHANFDILSAMTTSLIFLLISQQIRQSISKATDLVIENIAKQFCLVPDELKETIRKIRRRLHRNAIAKDRAKRVKKLVKRQE